MSGARAQHLRAMTALLAVARMQRQLAPKARAARNPGTTITLGSVDFVHAHADA